MNYQVFLFVLLTWNQFAAAVSGVGLCDGALKIGSSETDLTMSRNSSVNLNCTVLVDHNASKSGCEAHLQWRRNGEPLPSLDAIILNTSEWFTNDGQLIVSSVLTVTLKENADFGVYSCDIWNKTVTIRIRSSLLANHIGAVMASLVLFVVLIMSAVFYIKCRLNFKLWYKNYYEDFEINDGKIYDAYVSYISSDNDRKFVNFILKPHLETKYGQKLFLSDANILPGAEPSAELLMHISRCRRLIVVLSQDYLEQEWCTTNFRQGLFYMLELSQRPIFIIFKSQQKHVSEDVLQQLRKNQPHITTLIWGAHSITPSSGFWKELELVMPRKLVLHSESAGDPQTLLQGDKDPMLTVEPDYLDCRPDPDPAGDLGVRLPCFKAMSSRHPVLPAVSDLILESKSAELDVSDLGSRSYAVRTDFYCLVTEDDM